MRSQHPDFYIDQLLIIDSIVLKSLDTVKCKFITLIILWPKELVYKIANCIPAVFDYIL